MTRGKVCPARGNRACRAMWCTPAGKKLIYSNSRVHGNRTLGVVSQPLTTITGYLIKHVTITVLNAPEIFFLAGSRGRISGYYVVTCYYFMITETHQDNM